MKKVSYLNVNITGGFWKKKLDMISDITVDSVYNRFKETYRFDAVDCTWKEGDPNQPHVFWDSDIAKWIEGLAYSLKNKPNDKMVAVADETISKIEKNRDEHGYYNSHFLVTGQRFTERNEHELYCLGHLIEAAIAYYHATKKDKLLGVEACLWTEFVPTMKKAGYQSFPRFGAYSETAWTDKKEKSYDRFCEKLPFYEYMLSSEGWNFAKEKEASPKGVRKLGSRLYWERRKLCWQGLHNIIDNIKVERKYKGEENK